MKELVESFKKLTVSEIREYLKSEISAFLVGEYREMSTENKHYLYKLYSFLYFCNELKDKEKILGCMQRMCDEKEFIDRYQILNKVK